MAVKIMKPSALPDSKVKFIQEAAILGQFFHSNVVKLYGVVTLNNPVSAIILISVSPPPHFNNPTEMIVLNPITEC